MQVYAKAIVAVLGALAISVGIEIDEAAWAQIASAITAVLVWAVPNARGR